MNGDSFLELFQQTLPFLDDNCVIVMDNAPYHSVKSEKIPNISWKKVSIINWLREKGQEVDETMVKLELLDIVKTIKQEYNTYVIDELAKKENKIVLRLPPYHCELNPIELAWSMVKHYVKVNNTTFKIEDVKKLLYEGIDRVTAENWQNFEKHTIEEETKFLNIDGTVDNVIDDVVISITAETSTSESEDSD